MCSRHLLLVNRVFALVEDHVDLAPGGRPVPPRVLDPRRGAGGVPPGDRGPRSRSPAGSPARRGQRGGRWACGRAARQGNQLARRDGWKRDAAIQGERSINRWDPNEIQAMKLACVIQHRSPRRCFC
jgi:hypothetical protein